MTAAARDELAKRGVEIVHGPAPGNAAACREDAAHGCLPPDAERIFLGVAAMLQSRYGVTDPAELHKLSCHVAQIMKNYL